MNQQIPRRQLYYPFSCHSSLENILAVPRAGWQQTPDGLNPAGLPLVDETAGQFGRLGRSATIALSFY